jgi:hypothetical protein
LFALFVAAILILVVLLVGGPVLIGLGVYIGVLAYRGQPRAVVDPATVSIPVHSNSTPATATAPNGAGRKFFRLDPSYGLSATCIGVGVLMFIGGVALIKSPDKPASYTKPPTYDSGFPTYAPELPTYASQAPVVLPTMPPPTREPAFVTPDPYWTSASPTPVHLPQPDAGSDAIQSQSAGLPPEPALPHTTSPEVPDAGDDNSAGGGDSAVYYENCAAARAAGAAPLYAGEPGYRSALDRDHNGIACE